jgi:Leucine-rich repeat (LRR) protein
MQKRIQETMQYRRDMERRRLELKEDGKREWEVLADPETGDSFYWNHITRKRRDDMPTSLDKFGDLQRLESLVINAGDLQSLPLSLFKRAHPIRKIEIQGNRLQSVPDGIWRCVSLQSLRLPGNKLKLLPDTLGRVLTLTELDVTGNSIVKLPRSLGDCAALKKLFISHNRLRDIPPTLCRCRKIESLVLSHNPFQKCADMVETVEKLGIPGFLKHCRERYAREKRGLPPDGNLMVSHGVNDSLSQKDIRQRQSLMAEIQVSLETRKLYWFWNALPALNNNILSCDHLTDLRLVGNKIERLPDGLSVLRSLKILVVHSNQITSIGDKALRGANGSLTTLDVSMNKLQALPDKMVRLRKLKHLRLKSNQIPSLPKDIGKIRKLETLDLGMNRLQSLPASFCDLVNLTFLDLQRNQLENGALPEDLSALRELKSLNLTHNRFTKLPFCVGGLLALVELKMASNLVAEIPESLSRGALCTTLETMWLPNNKLQTVPLSLAKLEGLKSVMLDGNPLISPPVDIAQGGHYVVRKYILERQRRMTTLFGMLRGTIRRENDKNPPVTEARARRNLEKARRMVEGVGEEEDEDVKEAERGENAPDTEGGGGGGGESKSGGGESKRVERGSGVLIGEDGEEALSEAEKEEKEADGNHSWMIGIRFVSASGLKKADFFGKSDPYVEFSVNDVVIGQSKTIKKTLNPKWDERKEFVIHSDTPLSFLSPPTNVRLVFEIFDWDLVGDDDPLGRITIEGAELLDFVHDRDIAAIGLPRPLLERDGKPSKGKLTIAVTEIRPATLEEHKEAARLKAEAEAARLAANNSLWGRLTGAGKNNNAGDDDAGRGAHGTIPFEIEEANVFPKCNGALIGAGNGYLLTEDLKAFDDRVDLFINGDFERDSPDKNSEAIYEWILKLRKDRAHETLGTVLKIILKALQRLNKTERRRRWYEDDEVIFEGVKRAFGRDRSKVKCFQFTLRALFDGRNEKRPILSLIEGGSVEQLEGDWEIGYKLDRVHVHKGVPAPSKANTLLFDEVLVLAALRSCVGPYGRYAAVEPLVTECHCDVVHPNLDDEEREHTVGDSGVMAITMFSYEEAARWQNEEQDIALYGTLAKKEVKHWTTKQKSGKKALKSRVRSLKKEVNAEIKKLKADMTELEQDKKAKTLDYKLIKSRAQKFDRDPTAVETHGFSGRKNKDRILGEAKQAKQASAQAVKDAQEKRDVLRKRKKQKKKVWNTDALKAMQRERAEESRIKIVEEGRVDAMKRGLRRPWDGEDGKNYMVWLRERRGEAEDSESESDEDESFDSIDEWSDEGEDELDVDLNAGAPALSRSESQMSPPAAAGGSDFSFGGFLQGRGGSGGGGAQSPEQEEEDPDLAGISDSDEEEV